MQKAYVLSTCVALTLALACSKPLHAQDKACIQSYEDAQVRRRDSQLIAARQAAVRCASGCPSSLAKDCAQWIGEIESSIPRVVLEARDANGTSLVDVSVSIDGKPMASQLQGRTVEVDPGPHVFVFTTKGADDVRLQTVVVESEKNHRISAQFPDYFLARRSAPIPKIAWVFAGTGGVALGAAAVFGALAWSQRQDLEKQDCAPACPGQDVSRLSRTATIADVSLAFGVTALAGAAAVWLVTRPPAANRASNEGVLQGSRPLFYALPLPHGAAFGTRLLW